MQAQTIAVISPNGGESWAGGSAHTINWNAVGVAGNVNITLLKAGAGYQSIATGVPASQGTYIWSLPVNLPVAGDYSVRVMSATDNTVFDASNNPFSVSAATLGVTVVSPNGGEVWTVGTTHTLSWVSVGIPGNVNITLLRNGVGYQTIANGVPASQGSYSWTLPNSLPVASDYSVRVMSATDSTIYDASNTKFSVTLPPVYAMVTAPNGGEVWSAATTRTVTWNAVGFTGNVNLTLLKNGIGYKSIATVPASQGTYSWMIPTSVAAGTDYKVRVMSATDSTIYDASNNNFSVTVPSVAVTVQAPNGGEVWSMGTTRAITWTSIGMTGNVNLTLLKAGIGYRAIATVPVSQGSYSWAVPTNLPVANDYSIRIMSATDSTIYDASDLKFSVAPQPVGVIVTYPNGGETWQTGMSQNITWTQNGVAGNVNVTLLKAGLGYKTIATNVPASQGSYNWLVPPTVAVGSDYSVRVMSATDSTLFDVSNANFSVISGAPVINAQPLNQIVNVGQTANFNVGASGVGTLTYQWYKNGSLIAGATGSGYTTPPTTMADNGALFSVTVTNSAGSTPSNNATLTVNPPPSYQVSGNINLMNGGPNGGLPGVSVTINTVPPQTAITDQNGNFNLNNIQNGNYTLTPTLNGANAIFYPPTQNVNVSNGNAFTSFMAAVGYTVSGTVSYAGAQTGRVYLSLGGNNYPLGTSIAAPGAFNIRGVPPGNYVLYAWMDNVGSGIQNVSNPAGYIYPVTIPGANANILLTDPTVPSIATMTPTFQGIAGSDGAAIVFVNPLVDITGTEIPTQYTLDWGTDPTFVTRLGRATYTANGGHQPYIVSGLPNGTTMFFRVKGKGNDDSLWATSSGVLINPSAGGNVVSGTVTFPGTATGPMYVGFYDQNTGQMYSTSITSPVSPQPYTVNVPSGTNYFNFAIIDQNNSGTIDVGDISNTDQDKQMSVAISGPSVQNVTLSGAGSFARLQTNHSRWIPQGGGQANDSYGLSFDVRGNVKRPVAVALTSGTGLLAPVDIAMQPYGRGEFQFWPQLGSGRPSVGATYGLSVTYSDGSSETLNPAVTGVLDAFATNLAPGTNATGNVTPTFTWTQPTNPSNYTYSFSLWDNNGNNVWQIPKDNPSFPSSITSIVWGVDPLNNGNLPWPSILSIGTTYSWSLWVMDAQGNSASAQTSFTP